MRPITVGFGWAGWAYFRNHPVTIRDQNGLTAGGEPDIFTQLIFQQFETNGAHGGQCSFQRLLCQSSANWSRQSRLNKLGGPRLIFEAFLPWLTQAHPRGHRRSRR